jgi:hypothetical protein
MALVLKDRVKETTTTTGTGTVTLAGAAAGFQSFVVIGDGNQTFYSIVDSTSGAWEVGVGTYTASGTTLSRTTVVSSSNAGSLVSFGAGSKDVFVTYPSSRAVYLDAAGSAVTTLDIGTLGTSTANISTANITAGTVATAPVNNTDIVNKEYADAIASGIHFHEAVDLATTAALPANTYNNGTSGVGATLTGNANGALSVDSTLTVATNRILVKNEAAGANNGVYVVTQVGSAGTPYILTRADDFDSVGTGVDQIDEGDFFLVTSGTANVNTAWVQQTPPPITLGTTAIVFQQFSAPITYTAGTGLSESPAYTFNIANTGTAGTYGSASSVPVITTNAQGQVTGVTPTAISISGAAVSGNISGSAGSVANALTAGSFLTSGGTFDGSAARTFAVDATNLNTASKVVARDASGNFSANTITATLSGSATSATTATNLAGGAANRIAYQTSAGATTFAVAPTASNQVLNWNGSAFTWSAGTISGIALGSNLSTLTFGTYLTGTSYNGSTAVTLATNATNLNTASTIVARDASGNFTAGTITAALSGNASTATSATTATTATNLSGFTLNSVSVPIDPNNVTQNQLGYANSVSLFGQTDGGLYSSAYSSAWIHQIFGDFRTGQIAIRGKNSGTFQAWRTVLDSSNYTSYAPSLTGSGASGTWGINVTGNAATATALQTARTINGVSFNGTANITVTAAANGGNSATVGGFTPSQSAGVANRVVVADAGGYLNNNYFNSTDNTVSSGVTNVMVKAGDNYYRSGTAAAVATFISGQAMNITGTASANLPLSGGTMTGTIINSAASLIIGTNGGVTRGYVYNDAAGIGFLTNGGGWAARVDYGTSNFFVANNLTTGNLIRAGTNVYWDQNYGYGAVGLYVYNRYQGVYAMGDAYKLPADGTTTGSLYGIAWSYPGGQGGPSVNLNTHGALIMENGTFLAALSGSIRCRDDMRTPVYYDLNNTGYYLDPTSTQSLRTVGDWRSDAAAWTGEFSGKIQYHASNWYIQAAGGVQFRNSAGSQTMYVDSSGNLTATANITAYSDARLKENVVTVDNALDKATALRGVYYNKIGDPRRRVGVIAQEIQEVLPEVVLTITEKNPATGEESEMLAVDYGNIVGLLIEAVKELRAEVEKLKGNQ